MHRQLQSHVLWSAAIDGTSFAVRNVQINSGQDQLESAVHKGDLAQGSLTPQIPFSVLTKGARCSHSFKMSLLTLSPRKCMPVVSTSCLLPVNEERIGARRTSLAVVIRIMD